MCFGVCLCFGVGVCVCVCVCLYVCVCVHLLACLCSLKSPHGEYTIRWCPIDIIHVHVEYLHILDLDLAAATWFAADNFTTL